MKTVVQKIVLLLDSLPTYIFRPRSKIRYDYRIYIIFTRDSSHSPNDRSNYSERDRFVEFFKIFRLPFETHHKSSSQGFFNSLKKRNQ